MSDLSGEILPQDIFEGYGGDEQRLFSYATLMGVFNLIFAFFLLLTKDSKTPTRADRAKGHSPARGGNPQAEHDRSQGRCHQPYSRSFHRATGDEEPEERRRAPPWRRAAKVYRRVADVPFLPWVVGGSLLHLRPCTRAARHPLASQHFHHLHPL